VLHPAVEAGKLEYTFIGCGDFYNQDREPVWWPWMATDLPGGEYMIRYVGDKDARVDCTNLDDLDDLAEYLVATLERARDVGQQDAEPSRPTRSRTPRSRGCWRGPPGPRSGSSTSARSAFPVGFWMMVKGRQGQDRFRRPRTECHNEVVPNVHKTTSERFLEQRFGRKVGARR